MERLTTRCAGYAVMAWEHEEQHTTQEWIDMLTDRLADYEDTGMTPEEIEALKGNTQRKLPAVVDDALEAKANHVRDLLQAEREGRLVVLPCKVGDTVYRVITLRDGPASILERQVKTLGQAAELVGRVGKKCKLISVYATREEAEAALKGDGYES